MKTPIKVRFSHYFYQKSNANANFEIAVKIFGVVKFSSFLLGQKFVTVEFEFF